MKRVTGLAMVAAGLLGMRADAQGNLTPPDGGFFCALEVADADSVRSEECELVFYPGDPAGYLVRFKGRQVDIHGDPFRDDTVTIDGKPAQREGSGPTCYAFDDGSGKFCIGN